MPNWNYRVMRRDARQLVSGDLEVVFSIHEVYYSKDGVPNGWVERPCYPQGETIEELQKDLAKYAAAMERPVLVVGGDGVLFADRRVGDRTSVAQRR